MNTKVLIIRFSSIGDIVLTTPVIRCIKTQRKDIELHFCTKLIYKDIIENNPYIDKRFYLEDHLFKLIKQLKEQKYDYIIDLHNNLRTFIIKLYLLAAPLNPGLPESEKRGIGETERRKTKRFTHSPIRPFTDSGRLGVRGRARSYSFNKLNFYKWLFVNFKINRLPNLHIVDRYIESVKPLGVVNDNVGLQYFIPKNDYIDINTLQAPYQQGFVAFAIGAKHYTKKLPFDKIIELCDKINKPIILLGDKSDHQVAEKVAKFFLTKEKTTQYKTLLKKINKKTVIYNTCGKYNLNQSASLIKQASVVFSHDTGLMHIAAAYKKKIFSIWGNTTPLFGMYPYNTKFTVFENNKLKCRPCSKLGFKKCPKGHFKCMRDLVFLI